MPFIKKLVLLLLLTTSFGAFAGNGVERGAVKIDGNPGSLIIEIENFLSKQLSRCALYAHDDIFKIDSVREEHDRIDQGVIDVYYSIQLKHLNEEGRILNTIEIKVLDSDYDNWRDYEEKLSIEFVNDQNNFCKI